MNSEAVGIALGILGAYGALLIFPPLFEAFAGWPQLVAHFASPLPGAQAPIGYASLGRLLTIPVRLGASSYGLHVSGSYFPPWRTKCSVCIPWHALSQRTSGGLLAGTCFVVASSPEVRIRANRVVAMRLRDHLVNASAA